MGGESHAEILTQALGKLGETASLAISAAILVVALPARNTLPRFPVAGGIRGVGMPTPTMLTYM